MTPHVRGDAGHLSGRVQHGLRPGRADHYLPTLDGWRAIAILGVLVSHASDQLVGPHGRQPDARLYAFTQLGALGVDVFFGISGFLITMRLLAEFDARGSLDLRSFYVRRIFRIVPPYVAYLAGATLLAVTPGPGGWAREVASCLLFFRNYYPGGGWFTAHFWSLAIEEHFYLLWPVFLAVVAARRLTWAVVFIALAIGGWRTADDHFQILSPLSSGVAFLQRTDIRLDALLMGCVGALIFTRYRDGCVRLLHPGTWTALVLAFVVCVTARPPLSLTLTAIIVPLLLMGTVGRPGTWIGRLLESAIASWIGRVSYSLYLWQQLFLIPGDALPLSRIAPVQMLPLNLLAVFACAAGSYYAIERPLIAAGHRLAASLRSRAATQARLSL